MRHRDVALAWVLLGAYGALARGRGALARSALLRALRRASGPGPVEREVASGDDGRLDHLLAAFERASQGHPISRSCVPRALALHRLLELHGQPARVRLGLDPSAQARAGHAWVECGGVPVGQGGGALSRYLPCETS